MGRFVRTGLGCIAGYAVGAIAGLLLVSLASANQHDKAQELVMTAIFFTGPTGALIGLVAGLLLRRK